MAVEEMIAEAATGAPPPAAPPPGAPPGAAPAAGPPTEDPTADPMAEGAAEGEQASPELQDAYEKVVAEAVAAVTGEGYAKQMLMRITRAEEPELGVAEEAVRAVTTLDGALDDSIPGEVIIDATIAVADQIASIAETAGILDGSPESKEKLGGAVVALTQEVYSGEQG